MTTIRRSSPTEAPVVRGVFEDAANGLLIAEIVERLTAAGHRTRVREWGSPQGARRAVGGRSFRADVIRAMLRNSIYAGRIRFLKQEYPGIHEALVTDEVWSKANRMANNKREKLVPPLGQCEGADPSSRGRRYCHAIHRSLEWQLCRAKQPKQTTVEFAKAMNVSVAKADFHSRLLKLAPEIQVYLLKLTDREFIRRFGMMEMLNLGRLEASAQLVQFAAMQDEANRVQVLPIVVDS